MKKFVSVVVAFSLLLMMSCSSSKTSTQSNSDKYEIAMVLTKGRIDDKAYNEASWNGIKKFATENNKTCKYYEADEEEAEAYIEKIDEAVEGGAKVIVCPGYWFGVPVFICQDKYPDVKFILIDDEPHNEDYTAINNAENTLSVLFKEDQCGFLAGYGIVKEGYTNLGFIGGMDTAAVIRFGYGFLQGAEYAAKEENKKVNVKYTYCGSFAPSPNLVRIATDWYNSGVECIFACAGGAGKSVMEAAEKTNKLVIGVDSDQSSVSDTVITSAIKKIDNSVYISLSDYYAGSFLGGTSLVFRAINDGVGLAMQNSRFKRFTEDDYDNIIDAMKKGKINIIDNTSTPDASILKPVLTRTKVEYIE